MTKNEYMNKLNKLVSLYQYICKYLNEVVFQNVNDGYAWWDRQGKGNQMSTTFFKAYAKFRATCLIGNSTESEYIEDHLIDSKQAEWMGEKILDWVRTYVPQWQIDAAYKQGSIYTSVEEAWELIKKLMKWKMN